MISDIEQWAREIAGDSPHAQRLLILGWSAFPGKGNETITIGRRALHEVSPGWLRQIHRRAQKAYKNHLSKNHGTLDMFHVKHKQPVRDDSEASEEMWDGPENHPEDLPF